MGCENDMWKCWVCDFFLFFCLFIYFVFFLLVSLMMKYEYELLFEEIESWFIFFLIKYFDIWLFYKKVEVLFWSVEEVDLLKDIYDWNDWFNDNERYFIFYVFVFFVLLDVIVNENLIVWFC